MQDDVVSRQTVKEQMIKYGFHAPDMTVTEFVEDMLPSVKPQPCEDAISRKAVLEQLKGCLTGGDTEHKYVKLHIDSIPSVTKMRDATPEERKSVNDYVESISKPTGVNFWDLQEPCDDVVSRQAVLDAVSVGCKEWRGVFQRCEKLIEQLPSVQPNKVDYKKKGDI